jgi:RNA polymerase-associated protein CTR9
MIRCGQYETASQRFFSGHNVPVLMCLCRSWYSKALKDQSLVAINTALRYAESVGIPFHFLGAYYG